MSLPTRWHSTPSSPQTYTTPFDPIEKITHYYARLNPHLPQWTISSGAILPSSTSYTVSQLKSAWLKLRYNHPIIAARISKDFSGLEYSTFQTSEEITQWLEESVIIIDTPSSSGISGRELSRELNAPKSGEVYYIPSRHEIFLHLPHEVSDGMGSILLLNNLLKILRTEELTVPPPVFGDEIERLPPSLFDVLNKNWRGGVLGQILPEAENVFHRFLRNDSISLGVKSGVGRDTVPRLPSGRVEYRFSAEETEKIVTTCKKKGITVTNAIMAANGLKLLEDCGKQKAGLSNLVSVNLRPVIGEPYDKQAGGNMFVDTFSVFEVDNSDDEPKGFEKLAREVKEELLRWKFDDRFVGYTPHIVQRLEEVTRRAVEEEEEKGGSIGKSGFVISSLGVVDDNRYLEEEVEDFWFGIGVASVGAGCLFIWTVRGQLTVAVCYNEEWFEEGKVEGFVEGVVGGLRRGLELV
ncbi:hypothetical protein TWF281_010326 [Arthrobotrys megalospora]